MDDPALEFPMFDDAVKRDPYPYYARMREIGPIMRNPALLGAWMVAAHEPAQAVLTDHARFSSAQMSGMQDRISAFDAPTMLNSDPPDHERLRGVVARAFTPRSIAALEPRLRNLTEEMLAPLRDGEPFDVVDQLAYPLPVMAISELLGVSVDDRASFRTWSNQLIAGTNEMASEEALAQSREGAEHLKAYFREEIARRRAQPGGDDLVSRLVEANEGDVLDDAELLSSCVLLLVAGNETTTNLIANQALALGRNRDERARILAEPALVPAAVEEVMRFDSPVQATLRVPTTDVQVAGQQVAKGEMVFVLLAAANRDPAKFTDPERFDVGRSPNPQLGFGHGIHFCLGAALAKLEARLALERLLALAPDYELRCDPATLDYGPSFIFHSPKTLPIVA
ncbi:MAG TPA: cytochrome P450 [Acidimicrobiales bacterium]|nr:cytochrome P450 [Acidimicrobiales bacterium]